MSSATAPENRGIYRLKAAGCELILHAVKGERPHIVHWGAALAASSAGELALLGFAQPPLGSTTRTVPPSLSCEPATGIGTPPGLLIQRSRLDWLADLRVVLVDQDGPHAMDIVCEDASAGVRVRYAFVLGDDTGVLTASTEVTNLGDAPLSVEWCAAPILPIDQRLTHITGYSGRWAGEFQPETLDRFRGSYLRENRAGRTSHDCPPFLLLDSASTTEHAGRAAAFHLAWSGNHRMRVDTGQDGRALLQAGELLLPGEIVLGCGESYTSPELVAVSDSQGRNALSRRLHHHVRGAVLDPRTAGRPRPVHFNTWEAVYFGHDEARLTALADQAAAVGAERFVLDDGWFGGRRGDAAGLGDWYVSPDIYPAGLRPLADHVRSLGMEFGLWFEPEMVNPDSDLYRAHPDWVLGAGVEDLPFRNQLTLNLTRPEVADYLFDRIAAVVVEADVAYIKWDMNRDTVHPSSAGRAVMHRQTLAVYAMIDRLRARFPKLEIESCSSGGARVDYGILQRTDRVWTSDNNDALERQRMQREIGRFLPLSVTGSHVGPRRCHSTGRVLDMAFRAGTAIFGHMGMELNLADENEADRATLAAGITLHKQHRRLIHQGELHRLDCPAPLCGFAVSADDSSEALVSVASLDSLTASRAPRLFLPMLESEQRYRIRLVWPLKPDFPGLRSIVEEADLTGEGLVASGTALAEMGLQLPMMHPQTCLILHLKVTD